MSLYTQYDRLPDRPPDRTWGAFRAALRGAIAYDQKRDLNSNDFLAIARAYGRPWAEIPNDEQGFFTTCFYMGMEKAERYEKGKQQ